MAENRAMTRKEREVWHACDRLWEQGLFLSKLTGEAVGAMLQSLGYSKGSNTDIHRFKKTWVAARGIGNEPNSTNESQPLSDPILLAAKALREEMHNEAKSSIDKIQQDASAQIQALEQAHALLQQEFTDNQSLYQTFKQDYDHLNQQHSTLAEDFKREQYQRLLAQEQQNLQAQHLADMRVLYQQTETALNGQVALLKSEHQLIISELRTQQEAQRHLWIVAEDALKLKVEKSRAKIELLKQEQGGFLMQNKMLDQAIADQNLEIARLNNKLQCFARLEGENRQLHESLLDARSNLTNMLAEQSRKKAKRADGFRLKAFVKLKKKTETA